jgi:hypothetical protein
MAPISKEKYVDAEVFVDCVWGIKGVPPAMNERATTPPVAQDVEAQRAPTWVTSLSRLECRRVPLLASPAV